jgi:2-polyprenyl-6-methoxyphenol hydroxylase-like FAD-dependent oxidoreductase
VVNEAGDKRVSVLVVGAGPVGLVLACELARRGTRIRLIDRLPEPTGESRAIIVHARSLEMMERIGVVDELIASGVRATAMEFHADGVTIGRLPLDTVDSPFPFSLSTAQTETERVLTERLAALGFTIDRGVELVSLEQDDDEVRSTLRHTDGGEETLVSAYIAGTDGSHSTVRGLVGTKLEGSFKGERFLLGDVEADYKLDRDSMHTYFSADAGPLLIFPMQGQRLRLIAQINDERDLVSTIGALQQVCDARAGAIEVRSAHWITIFEIHHAQVPAYRFGRAFLAGDAAHVHSPAGGQGMNTGMQDALNLGWKLALASAGKAAPGLLDSYHDERHPVAARVIRHTTRLTTAGTLEHRLARRLRNYATQLATALAPVQHALADRVEETDIAYCDSPIVGRSPRSLKGPRPGQAAPDVAGVEPALHAALAEAAGHTALHVAGQHDVPGPLAGADGLRQLLVADRDPGTFDAVVLDPDRRVAKRYGIGDEGGLVLIRPDGYIGLRAELGNQDAVASYLAGVASPQVS